MGGVEVGGAVRALRDDQIGPPATDLSRHVSAEIPRVLDLAVHVAEEPDALDPERLRGIRLLVLPDRRQPLGRHRAVARPLAAVGHDDVGDLLAVPPELRDGATRAELGIVRMGGDDHDPFDVDAHAA